MRIGSKADVLNNGLYRSVVDAKNIWRKGGKGRVVRKSLSIIVTYTQVDNTLGLHLKSLQIL